MDCGRLHTPLLVKSFAVIGFPETIGEGYFGACENEPVKISEWTPLRYRFQSWKYTWLVAFSWPYFVPRNENFKYRSPNYIHCIKITSTAMVISPMLWQSWTIKLWPHVVDWFWYEIKKPCQYQIWDQKYLKRHICHMLDNYRFCNIHLSQLNHFSIWRVYQSYFVLCCLPYDPHLYSPFYADLAASLSM